ncbi:glycoside hydrolase family 97 protein [Dysgonomonas macrotermitis]|uniref:Glycosyl-hydrolase 97 C-terminal, oligomerisation n=1 Tax=Dysgonomonas macrotermitis TaxID=1346286 RepID=A0A1M5EHG4_9BACT|nr:glycoside hydrolase family 97 protein [Dysgonomonas macrotermitis]SHF78501.1 Glycosyl-hydrolase 97 C-terminal, oligomerisation [Dysgonomonas macrotermitis]
MKKNILTLGLVVVSTFLSAQTVSSPDGMLKVEIKTSDNKLFYNVRYQDKVMLEDSPLGLETSIGDFANTLVPVNSVQNKIDEEYILPHGKASLIQYQANQLICSYTNGGVDTLQVIFNVSNNNIAQSYRVASKNKVRCIVLKENTGFKLPQTATTFITPQAPWGSGWQATKPSYEEEYTVDEPVGRKSTYGLGYTFPALFHRGNDGWVLISETGVTSNYVGTKLSEGTSDGLYMISFPEKEENAGIGEQGVSAALPLTTSWKTITVGETLKPIVETTISYDVVKPVIEPTQVYKAGKSCWSWLVWQDNSVNYDDQIKFIDLASKMNIEYVLVDGWWDTQIGRDRIPSLVAYARSKGVGIILWYNSNGSWNDAPQTPQDRMDTAPARQREMAWLQSIGVKGIKVDFFGGDKQVTMRLYEDILTDANRCGIHVNFHGATLPRGWEKMYPNHMTSEAVLGSENIIFQQKYADMEAFTSTILPFTRNTTAAMDFGPLYLNKILSKDQKKGSKRVTTDAFQLATAVIYQSGIQHLGITPNILDEQPDYVLDFIKYVPATWDETRFVDGYPGKYVVMARRTGNQWYIAATNAEKSAKTLKLSLPWLAGKQLNMISDRPDGSAANEKVVVGKDGSVTIKMESSGGVVLF